ncbi:MAG: hypothetical protein HY319_08810 [Armatimonadetes bacterium]|nr:hypothetical protein [Armatimonadota bacterium]
MLTEYVLADPLHGIAILAGLVLLDFGLAPLGRRILDRAVDERARPEFLRMNPLYLERPRGLLGFAMTALGTAVVVFGSWWLSQETFLFLFGSLFFARLISLVRHLRSFLALVWLKLMPGAVEGGVRYSQAYVYRSSGTELLLWAGLLGVAYAVVANPMFHGGAVTVGLIGLGHLFRSLRKRKSMLES